MDNTSLTVKSALGGLQKNFSGVTIAEITGKAIVSIAIPSGIENRLATALEEAYEIEIAPVGQSAIATNETTRLLRLQRDQMFIIFDHDDRDPVAIIAQNLGDAGYYTDQSDSLVCIHISGPQSRSALERICPIDLHPDIFCEGAVTRTLMEHLGVIILRDGVNSFQLFSAQSSANSFLHAIETSIKNIG